MCQRRVVQEPITWHENVPDIPLDLLAGALGDIYVICEEASLIMNPAKFGQAYERPRRITLCRHKQSIVFRVDMPLRTFITNFEQECTWGWGSL